MKPLRGLLEALKPVSQMPVHEFLPAVLEITERPPNRAALWIIWTIMIFFVTLVLWAYFGQVDIVVSARGKVIPSDHVKLVQAPEPGIVRVLHVRERQFVSHGELLVELDPTISVADKMRLETEIAGLELDIERVTRLYDRALEESMGDAISAPEHSLFRAQLDEYLLQRQTLEAEIRRAKSGISSVEAEITKLEALLPITRKRVSNFERLAKDSLISEEDKLRQQEALIIQENDLAAQQHRSEELKSALEAMKSNYARVKWEFMRKLLEQRQEFTRRRDVLEPELQKASARVAFQELRAPASGYIKELSVHTLGGVVGGGEQLMMVVPHTEDLAVEAMIENKDIGFLREGQVAEIKLDAFPYTKYGLIEGRLERIAADAVMVENVGLIYMASVKGNRTTAPPNITMIPGMTATIEIKTGQRRIIELFLSPLLRYQQESLRER